MMFMDEDDDEESEGLYANGHWAWDDKNNVLMFISDVAPTLAQTAGGFVSTAIVGPVEFKHDLDVIEQQRFKKRMQRKADGRNDVVKLQDVKDIVLYCAPAFLLTHNIINVLHTATTERFLRALILYCQYYIQVADIIEKRLVDLETKIPTLNSEAIMSLYQENLSDLRLIVAKEYCTMITGGGEFKRYHHMGKDKKAKSLNKKEALIFEPLIRISSQIVWVALARSNHTRIDLEINRLFRSKKFNLAERYLKQDVEPSMSTDQQHHVLRGQCYSACHTLNTHSPLFNEILCDSNHDFKMMGLGVIQYKNLDERLQFLENILTAPETEFPKLNINLGIIGLRRELFDPVLRAIQRPPTDGGDYRSETGMKFLSTRPSRISTTSKKCLKSTIKQSYPPVYLPEKTTEVILICREPQPAEFPDKSRPRLAIDSIQHKKWLDRVSKRSARKLNIPIKRFRFAF